MLGLIDPDRSIIARKSADAIAARALENAPDSASPLVMTEEFDGTITRGCVGALYIEGGMSPAEAATEHRRILRNLG